MVQPPYTSEKFSLLHYIGFKKKKSLQVYQMQYMRSYKRVGVEEVQVIVTCPMTRPWCDNTGDARSTRRCPETTSKKGTKVWLDSARFWLWLQYHFANQNQTRKFAVNQNYSAVN
jgi:hypothetical protein